MNKSLRIDYLQLLIAILQLHDGSGGSNMKWGGTEFKWGGQAPLVPPLATTMILSHTAIVRYLRRNHQVASTLSYAGRPRSEFTKS